MSGMSEAKDKRARTEATEAAAGYMQAFAGLVRNEHW